MTISTTINKIAYDGNDSATTFDFSFPIPTEDDLEVVLTDSDGVDTTISPSLYSVTGLGSTTGGTVTYPLSGSPVATGEILTINRVITTTQPTVLGNQSNYLPSVLEGALDRLTMIMQRFEDELARSIRVSVSEDGPDELVGAAGRANMALLFDADGAPYVGEMVGGTSGAATWIIDNLFPATSAANARTALGLGTAALLDAAPIMFPPQGRLSLVTAVPVMTSSQTGKTVIYYTPYVGNVVPIYNGSGMVPTAFTELSNTTTASSTGKAGPAAVANNSNYDLFVWSDSGTIRLTRGPAWSSDTSRGTGAGTTELERISGIYTNKVAITNGPAANRGTYVGSVRSDGSAQCNWKPGTVDTAALLNVWNAYNRVVAAGAVSDSTNTWTYGTATYRNANNVATVRVSFLQGLQEDFVAFDYHQAMANATGLGLSAIGINSSTSVTGKAAYCSSIAFTNACATARVQVLGFNYAQAIEIGDGATTTTFSGDNGQASPTTGLHYQGRF